jgi:hypothetical protein
MKIQQLIDELTKIENKEQEIKVQSEDKITGTHEDKQISRVLEIVKLDGDKKNYTLLTHF